MVWLCNCYFLGIDPFRPSFFVPTFIPFRPSFRSIPSLDNTFRPWTIRSVPEQIVPFNYIISWSWSLKKEYCTFFYTKWQVDCGCSSRVVSITFDSQGFMLLAFEATHKVVLYDTNGNYLNSLQTSQNPYHTAIDYD